MPSGLLTGIFGTLLGWPGWIVLAVAIAVLVLTGQFRCRPEPGLTLAESRLTGRAAVPATASERASV